MVSIIIYTTPEKLLHKQDKLEGDKDKSNIGEYVWTFQNNFPKKVTNYDKIYFSTKGFIRGYFQIEELSPKQILFLSKTWKNISPIKTKSFQGFKYADKVEGLE